MRWDDFMPWIFGVVFTISLLVGIRGALDEMDLCRRAGNGIAYCVLWWSQQ